MAITQRTRNYETLIRYNPDGTVNAQHQMIMEIIGDDGVSVIAATPQDLQPIAGSDLAAFLGTTVNTALTQIDNLNQQIGTLNQQIAILQSQNTALQQAPQSSS